jgi:hypothetical protein
MFLWLTAKDFELFYVLQICPSFIGIQSSYGVKLEQPSTPTKK